MTAKKAVVVAITSGTFVMGSVLNALTFNMAELRLGGEHIERMESISHEGDLGVPKHHERELGYTLQSVF